MANVGVAESALLEAARNRIRSAGDFTEVQCEVEHDELVPGTAGDVYVPVMPGGWRAGPAHRSSGGVIDELINIDIGVVMRLPKVPRDRTRAIYFERLQSLNALLQRVNDVVDFDYDLMNDANTLLGQKVSLTAGEGFIVPPVFSGVSAKPRVVGSEMYDAAHGQTRAGIMRVIHWSEARAMRTRT